MNKTVFEYKDYKLYLNELIENHPDGSRGLKSKIAQATQCQKAYISRVLNGDAHLSLEQADSLNEFLNHSSEEGHFFLLLVQYCRAGKKSLQTYFNNQIKKALDQRLLLKDRLGIKDTLSREDQATYYSAWYYAAIHMMLGIEKFQTKPAISRQLNLPIAQVTQVLDFLVSIGLAKEISNGRYGIGPTRLHLERDSPLISKHHTNWRMFAIRTLERPVDQDLHYSTVFGISDDDVAKVKTMTVKFIQEVMEVVHASKDEGVHCLSMDFFGI